MKKNLMIIVLLLLIFLTILEYIFSDLSIARHIALIVILLASFIKFIGVGFEFLELKHAHGFWKTFAVTLVSIFLIVITVVYW